MSPRCGPLCQDLSLERPFKGSVDFQTPRRWTNPRHTSWRSSVECYTICCALYFYHGADIEIRSLIMRHSLLTLFWLGDESTWGTWWWCTWSHIARARLTYSLMVTSSLECSRMSTLIWSKRQILRPPALMICMMISRWWGWNGWFLCKESKESTNTGPGTGTDTSQSWEGGRDTRNGGWSRPSEWLSVEKAQAWHSSTPVRGCLV